MNSHDMEYVLTLAKERSFSKAAKKLFITQPSLSRSILALEERLGCKLFDRSAKPVALTKEGELFVAAAARISEIEETFKRNIQKKQKQEASPLRLGISPFRATYYLPMVLGIYHKRYPYSKVYIEQGPILHLKQLLIQGEIDLVVGPGPVEGTNMEWERLPDDYIYLALPPDNIGIKDSDDCILSFNDIVSGKAHRADPISFARLENCEFISYKHAMLDQFLRKKAKENGFEPNIMFMMDNFHTVLSIVQQGLGCAFTFETVILSSKFELHPLYYRVDADPWEVVYIWRKGSQRSHTCEAFIDILKQKLIFRS